MNAETGTVRALPGPAVAYGEHRRPLTSEQFQRSSPECRVGSNDRVPSQPFLMSIHFFRAIAIILIVAQHSLESQWDMAWIRADTFVERLIFNLIIGGTGLFVFISGFLFHHVFFAKFNYRNFLVRKAKTILIPYTILSFIPTLLLIRSPDPNMGAYPFWKITLTGCSVGPYWFIPFIFTMFLLAPLYLLFARLRPNLQGSIIVVLVFISCLIHRPAWGCQPEFLIQNVIYYLPVFLLGFICSQHRSAVLALLERRKLMLIMVVLLFAAWQSYFYDGVGNFRKSPLPLTVVDVNLLQKIFLCLFLLVFVHGFEKKRNRVIELVATASFAIYFLHGFVIRWLFFLPDVVLYRGWASVPLIVIIATLICLALGYAVKLVIGSRSRFVIGW
jgi:peptidoglycan/LPS O-acetylase OafA/YrhL